MCGIGGFINATEAGDVEALRAMADEMRLRGPDGEGFLVAGALGLVHTRLAIRDLTDRGRCPMPNEDGTIQVVFNGEIYNWRELRKELESYGHHFDSSCDSEVLPHAYEEWGEGLFNRLRGMFALAIWDEARRRLVLGRDRVGEKPLFYAKPCDGFIFASSIAAVVAAMRTTPAINPDAIACYLAHSFIPATHTAFSGIDVFPPANYAVIEGGQIRFHRYWSLPDAAPRKQSVASAEQQLEQLLSDCVARCLDADVPVGVFLSGGVDSSVVAALAARHQSGLRSFSIGFDEQENNELPHARRVATAVGLIHEDAVLHVQDVIQLLPELVRAYDQPFGDPSAIPTYAVSRLARQHVKVCLSGDGGDESFAGYWRAQSVLYAARYARFVPHKLRSWLAEHPASILGGAGNRIAAANKLTVNGRHAAYTNSESWHNHLDDVAGPALRGSLTHDRVACRVGTGRNFRYASLLQRTLFDDFQVQLPDAYLRKVDVASMAASLEVRCPLLDVELVEFAWTLPDAVKLRWGTRKYLLKRIAARLVPPEVIYRPKMGFAMPLRQWFAGELGEYLGELLRDSIAVGAGFLDGRVVTSYLAEHQEKRGDHHVRLWCTLWLELWLRWQYGSVADHESVSPADSHVACVS